MRLVIPPEHRADWEMFERVFHDEGAPDEVIVAIWNSTANPVRHGLPLEEPRLRHAARQTAILARTLGWPAAVRG